MERGGCVWHAPRGTTCGRAAVQLHVWGGRRGHRGTACRVHGPPFALPRRTAGDVTLAPWAPGPGCTPLRAAAQQQALRLTVRAAATSCFENISALRTERFGVRFVTKASYLCAPCVCDGGLLQWAWGGLGACECTPLLVVGDVARGSANRVADWQCKPLLSVVGCLSLCNTTRIMTVHSGVTRAASLSHKALTTHPTACCRRRQPLHRMALAAACC